MSVQWESEIGGLLETLSEVQAELLELLKEKRILLAARDDEKLGGLREREEALIERLQNCQQRRQEILDNAAKEGLPSDSIHKLSAALPGNNATTLKNDIATAREKSRLLQHQSITNWVIAQRSLLHLSQMIEIIATGGRPRPTYGKGPPSSAGGSLVDQAV